MREGAAFKRWQINRRHPCADNPLGRPEFLVIGFDPPQARAVIVADLTGVIRTFPSPAK
jgi:hypothetical protein